MCWLFRPHARPGRHRARPTSRGPVPQQLAERSLSDSRERAQGACAGCSAPMHARAVTAQGQPHAAQRRRSWLNGRCQIAEKGGRGGMCCLLRPHACPGRHSARATSRGPAPPQLAERSLSDSRERARGAFGGCSTPMHARAATAPGQPHAAQCCSSWLNGRCQIVEKGRGGHVLAVPPTCTPGPSQRQGNLTRPISAAAAG